MDQQDLAMVDPSSTCEMDDAVQFTTASQLYFIHEQKELRSYAVHCTKMRQDEQRYQQVNATCEHTFGAILARRNGL